jgi:uncharacterized repeat protein (TIGR03803 family)
MRSVATGLISCALACAGIMHGREATASSEAILYSFCGQKNCPDGALRDAGLIDVKGDLFGTTAYGGARGDGTVFSVDPATGAETVVHSFCSRKHCADGSGPYASLINVEGTLYGTTVYGGAYSSGTVLSLDPASGAEMVLHSFGSGADGVYPDDSVSNVKDTLYGTTVEGGAGICYGQFTCGTVFSLDRATGAETVLYSFCSQANCPKGAYPHAGLINIKGVLYGTTESGGAYNGGTVLCARSGDWLRDGAAFIWQRDGRQRTLWRPAGQHDGHIRTGRD